MCFLLLAPLKHNNAYFSEKDSLPIELCLRLIWLHVLWIVSSTNQIVLPDCGSRAFVTQAFQEVYQVCSMGSLPPFLRWAIVSFFHIFGNTICLRHILKVYNRSLGHIYIAMDNTSLIIWWMEVLNVWRLRRFIFVHISGLWSFSVTRKQDFKNHNHLHLVSLSETRDFYFSDEPLLIFMGSSMDPKY